MKARYGVIRNNINACKAIEHRVDTANYKRYLGQTRKFNRIIKHPTENKWAYLVDLSMPSYYKKLLQAGETVQKLGEDWNYNE